MFAEVFRLLRLSLKIANGLRMNPVSVHQDDEQEGPVFMKDRSHRLDPSLTAHKDADLHYQYHSCDYFADCEADSDCLCKVVDRACQECACLR